MSVIFDCARVVENGDEGPSKPADLTVVAAVRISTGASACYRLKVRFRPRRTATSRVHSSPTSIFRSYFA